MSNFPDAKRETRYGVPAADQIMLNRHYVLGYSYYFRQAKWALEIVDPKKSDIERADNFRSDYRIPEMFRADLADYEGSGYDRGHLVASANQSETELQNSETFLLSNMSPQKPKFNRDIWKKLESAVRQLDKPKRIFETYVISGPIFNFDVPVLTIEPKGDKGVTLPIPHAYFKSILTENNRGALHMWSFIIPNEESDKPLEEFLVPTIKVERYAGLTLWERLVGRKIEREKSKIRKMWKHS
jgi:endonuclease G, mitochondrial